MLKKDIKYTDLDGKEVTETHYFHLNKADLAEIELSFDGGLEATLRRIIETKNGREIMNLFKFVIKQAYGVRHEDGRQFIKSEENWESFVRTDAYSELFSELVTDAEKGAEFMRGVVPANLADQVEENMKSVGALQSDLTELPAVENVFDKGQPEPEPVVATPGTEDPEPWITENREPTQRELATMSPEQLRRAYQRKSDALNSK